ncbi:MAG TPA: DUF3667 domain-containing protein [Caulobacteraceae bacterium]
MTDAAAPPALEPETPVEAAEAHAICANCSTALIGDWCHACGQKAHLQSKLRHLFREFFESIASFDGRLWRTLPLVAFRPGQLSRRWREGQRVRFVAPLHFFLFAVFLVFLMPTVTGRHLINLPQGMEVSAPEGQGLNAGVSVGMTREQIRARNQQRLREAEERVRAEAAAKGVSPEQMEGADAFAMRANQRLQKAFSNTEATNQRIEELASRLSFALVPITMVILWVLLLFKRGYSLYDHAVVALYGIGFLAVLIAFAMALPGQAANWAARALMVIAPVHAVVHLKGAYALSWPGAVIRGVFLGLFSSVAFGLFLLSVVLLGVFT